MQVAVVGMCVFWGGGVMGSVLSRGSQCSSVSLKLSVKPNTVCNLICSYSAVIFQRLAFWNWCRVGGSKMQLLVSLQLFGYLAFFAPPISHYPNFGLPD